MHGPFAGLLGRGQGVVAAVQVRGPGGWRWCTGAAATAATGTHGEAGAGSQAAASTHKAARSGTRATAV